MANCCLYTMHAVSKDENVLKRLLEIMKQNDNEYYIYRCQDVELTSSHKDGKFFVYELQGDVAWSAGSWINGDEIEDEVHTLENGAHYVSLDVLAKRLGFAFEIYTEEPGCQFQEWILCNHNGENWNETVDWEQEWYDEDGNELEEPVETGGFEDYCQFKSADEIWRGCGLI